MEKRRTFYVIKTTHVNQKQSLQSLCAAVAQRAMERKMLGYETDKKALTFVKKKQSQRHHCKNQRNEMEVAGHIARLTDNRWTLRSKEWQPRTGKKRRGRQKRRWRDELTSYRGAAWMQVAQDRRKWKMLEEGFILQRKNQPR